MGIREVRLRSGQISDLVFITCQYIGSIAHGNDGGTAVVVGQGDVAVVAHHYLTVLHGNFQLLLRNTDACQLQFIVVSFV